MPSNPDSGFQFRSVELASFYDENFGRSRRSAAAKNDLERYRLLLEESKVVLSVQDAKAVWMALNGANTQHVDMLLILKQSVASDLIEDGQKELAEKVASWSFCEWLFVVDACDRVGQGGYQVEDLDAELKRVGLCDE